MWKVLICLLRCKRKSYIRAVRAGGQVYVVRIEKYQSPNEWIKKASEIVFPRQ